MQIVAATRNPHKIAELCRITAASKIEWLGLDRFPGMPEVVEDGATFTANAIKKALETARYTGCCSLADDSGLEVAALDGAPGVYSARYAGEPVSYERNNLKLLHALQGHKNRSARFVCVLALCLPDGKCRTVKGVCDGTITEKLRGTDGFGYDPLFLPAGYSQTFAEMPMDEKNRISHRGRALAAAAGMLQDFCC